jgi:hypothetical protein
MCKEARREIVLMYLEKIEMVLGVSLFLAHTALN